MDPITTNGDNSGIHANYPGDVIDPHASMTNQQATDWINTIFDQNAHPGVATTGTNPAPGTIAHHAHSFHRTNVGTDLGVDHSGSTSFEGIYGDYSRVADAAENALYDHFNNHERVMAHQQIIDGYGSDLEPVFK